MSICEPNMETKKMDELCQNVRRLVDTNDLSLCKQIISSAMGTYPSAPEPHNLYGIVLELGGDHINAMKHFRAAWSLSPNYEPSRYNMDKFSEFPGHAQYAFDETDCRKYERSRQR